MTKVKSIDFLVDKTLMGATKLNQKNYQDTSGQESNQYERTRPFHWHDLLL
jgi:hypothetical protein